MPPKDSTGVDGVRGGLPWPRTTPAMRVAPLASAAVVVASCLAAAMWRFSRREI